MTYNVFHESLRAVPVRRPKDVRYWVPQTQVNSADAAALAVRNITHQGVHARVDHAAKIEYFERIAQAEEGGAA